MEGWDKAFILHHRPYGESSLLLDILSEQNGRLSLLAKGARRKRSELKGILQPFTPLFLRYSQRISSLKTLLAAEAASLPFPLTGKNLYCGFYVNELLIKTLSDGHVSSTLFFDYLQCLQSLSGEPQQREQILRLFEFSLLKELGYLVDFTTCCRTDRVVIATMNYYYIEQEGFAETALTHSAKCFTGKQLLAFSQHDFTDLDTLQAAKRFTRLAFYPALDGKPLKSRDLFKK